MYLVELPSGSRTITGVATSVTAFAGRALRGPADKPVPILSMAEFDQVFGGVWRDSGLGYAVRDFFGNGGNFALVVRLSGGAKTAVARVGDLVLEASGPGLWGNSLVVQVEHPDPGDAADVAAGQGVDAADLFHLTVREGGAEQPSAVERFLNLTVSDGPRRVDLVLEASRLIRTRDPLPTTRPVVGTFEVDAADRGDDGAALGRADYVPEADDPSQGIFALRTVELFNLLCLPPPAPAGDLPIGVWSKARDFCAERDALLLVDPPGTTTAAGLPDWVAQALPQHVNNRNAALYFPRVRQPDPGRGGAVGEFAPCGAVAGVMARGDATRGVWKAPAGTEAALTGVNSLAMPLTDAQNGLLNPLGINCLRTFRDAGTVVWGARTLRGTDALGDEYRYLPVRRLALFLKATLYRGTQWVVFEPNDAPLWAQIRLSIGAFMQDLFRQGAFQGSSPRDAFFVKCDAETTTQYDIDRGIVNIRVGFAPLKPAEFVVIGIQQKTSDAAA
ncbi:phage tail sheath subtilisin-like domain-containing protein [Actinomadura kijaniata]|uniref:Tail sheath protein n=1 Tax=Actinomadura namibiensis TaxID=182080 RepID=A0A7W3QRC6_ACTNM|nr:phage tail sheath subtilisin-like domain-containing protein [Actinomadura namibiensis]MBA8956594.1 hypothetical protein [Actinomadura namibiensis]